MERMGEVTAVQGEMLEVTFCRPTDCEKCNACHGGQKQVSLQIRGTAKAGDRVVVEMPESMVTRASIIAYVLPLAGLMGGMAAGEMLLPGRNSLGGIIGGIVGLCAAVAGIRLTEKKRQDSPDWAPTLLRVIPRDE